ncbi:hypothetical protein AVEN_180336-1 [Araneus ventricosus]|uniref:Uncharacterized protein n=1 Tax=Araneus ventricosus TaxID=182803 RepID=A0A4Y2LDC2_ARAVE|nr:hypothetical protein AVEN_180336-1 [Araneus ventricosus]
MEHISASHRWYVSPDGTYQCDPLVVRAGVNLLKIGIVDIGYSEGFQLKLLNQCKPPVVRAARWDISVRTVSGTCHLMEHISASHRWYVSPDGTYECEPPVVHFA